MPQQTPTPSPGIDAAHERELCAYLEQHPDFLQRHPAVLRQLEVPHASGEAVSLVERQISALRERNVELRHRLRDLTEAAAENEALYTHTRALVLELLESDSVEQLCAAFSAGMRAHFGSEHAALLVFAGEATIDVPEAQGPTTAGRMVQGEQAHTHLGALLRGTRPVCGALRPEEFAYLFAGAQRAGSAAIITLRQGERELGVLAVGSSNAARYHSQMGTLFLEHLAEVILRLLLRLPVAPAADTHA